MNWNQIFHQIADKILYRGEKYYNNNAVYDLEETHPGCWEARVEGTDSYEVSVSIGDSELGLVSCNCPHDAEICKHVAAVLYAVQAQMQSTQATKKKKTQKKKLKPADPEVKELLQHTGSKELATFIAGYATEDPSFKKAILAYFNSGEAADPRAFRRQADACFRGNGRDYYAAAYAAAKKLSILAERAAYMYRIGNYPTAAMLAQGIAESIPRNYESVDDSSGSVGGIFEDAIEVIRNIAADKRVAPDLKQSLVQWIKIETLDPIYDDYGFSSIHSLVIPLFVSVGMIAEALSYADDQISQAGWDYELIRALTWKLNLLEAIGKHDEANALALAHVRFPEFRKIVVTRLMNQKDYEAAIAMVQEGINIAADERYPGRVAQWQDLLLEIYEAAGDDSACVALAEKLFLTEYYVISYYRLLKRKAPPEAWKDYLNNLIGQMDPRHMSGRYDIPQIYIDEQNWEGLWELVQYEDLDTLDRYEKYLGSRFPDKVRDKYAAGIEIYAAKKTGRDHYRKIRSWIVQLYTYPGGDAIADSLLADFGVRYRMRRAMMEELGL